MAAGNVRYSQIRSGDRSGNGAKVATVTGSLTTNKQLVFDASGNIIASALSSGSGSSITSGAYASLPATCTTGDLYYTTDSLYVFVATATNTWTPYFNGRAGTLPGVASGWTADNLGGASLTDSNGSLYAVAPASATTPNLRAWYKTAPATPYTVTFIIFARIHFFNYNKVGILFRDGTGKITGNHYLHNGGTLFSTATYTTSTSGASAVGTDKTVPGLHYPYFHRLNDDGTNLTFSYSHNGTDYTTLYTVSRTSFFGSGPTQYGFHLEPQHSTLGCEATIISVKIT